MPSGGMDGARRGKVSIRTGGNMMMMGVGATGQNSSRLPGTLNASFNRSGFASASGTRVQAKRF